MKILATSEVREFVRARGSRLYVWTDRVRCCGGAMTLLQTSLDMPERGGELREFLSDGFTVLLEVGRLKPPDELHLELRGWRRKRVDAFWNGCAYVDEIAVVPVTVVRPQADVRDSAGGLGRAFAP